MYQYLLMSDEIINPEHYLLRRVSRSRIKLLSYQPAGIDPTRTCHAIRWEGDPVPYRDNIFLSDMFPGPVVFGLQGLPYIEYCTFM